LTCLSPPGAQPSSLTNVKETTMTIEQFIEELRLEAANAPTMEERRQIEAELDLAWAELAVIMAELDGTIEAEPPF
jgi:hypothetical protein